MRRYVEIIAVLRGIGTSYEEGLVGLNFRSGIQHLQFVRLRFVGMPLAEGVLYVGHKAALTGLVELIGKESVKANPCRTERRSELYNRR